MPYKDPAQRAAYSRGWHAANRTKHNAQIRAWSKANRDRRRTYARERLRGDPVRGIWQRMKQRARQQGIPCALTLADTRTLLAPMRCSATGLPLVHSKGRGAFTALSPSIDRMTPELGYVPGNVRATCHRFNTLRGTDPLAHDYRHALRVLAETDHTGDRTGNTEGRGFGVKIRGGLDCRAAPDSPMPPRATTNAPPGESPR